MQRYLYFIQVHYKYVTSNKYLIYTANYMYITYNVVKYIRTSSFPGLDHGILRIYYQN